MLSDGDEVSISPDRSQQLVAELLRVGIGGAGPMKGAFEVADECRKKTDDEDAAVRRLVRLHKAEAATAGFVTSLGGLITLPVSIPVSIGVSYIIQTRLVASIAHLRGHDLDDEDVRLAIVVCLLGNAGVEVVKHASVDAGTRVATNALKRLPGTALTKINQRVGFRLVTKFGERGVVNLVKVVPIVGGVVGSTVDYAACALVARVALRTFGPNGSVLLEPQAAENGTD